ncbi:hypothetical protein TX25_18740 [Pseudomonas lactis]|uniref:hypothetical protein n=1 Tax=Pseudomonas lactis TaxID=1615674 RepID=UPI0007140037|nr:hypothetical protein [Pseudomonas lactis]KRP91039.1 hypothetical protein TX25_18740 [Pseudomonas lactis]
MNRRDLEMEKLRAALPSIDSTVVLKWGPSGAVGMLVATLALNGSEFIGENYTSDIDRASEHLQALIERIKHDDVAVDALFAALLALSIDQSKKVKGDQERLALITSGLREVNKGKASAIDRAKAIAEDLWTADENRKVRTSQMADMVWKRLIDEGFSKQLPDNVERVRVWIRGVAPEFAKAKGRPKKILARNG